MLPSAPRSMPSTKSSKFLLSLSALLSLASLLAACEPAPACVYGDRIECRCGDAASSPFGYQQCSEQRRFEGPCRCDGVPQDSAPAPDASQTGPETGTGEP